LQDLLIEAIRYGELPETKARMEQVIAQALDTQHLKDLMTRNALVENQMSLDELYAIREEMDKAEARKLQPHFISSFFREAFRVLGGELRDREAGRLEVRHVPADVIERDRVIGHTRTPVLKKYERICFDREQRTVYGKPTADLVHPGHPLMAAVTDLVLSSHRSLLKRGAVLVDPHDDGTEPKVLFMLDHSGPGSLGEKALSLNGAFGQGVFNRPEVRAAQIPGANGIGNARALATIYAATIGEVNGVRLITEETRRLAATSVTPEGEPDVILGHPTVFGKGYMLDSTRNNYGGPGGFGHDGAGGSVACAVPSRGLAVSYVMNTMMTTYDGDPRREAYINAAVRCADAA